MKAKTKFKIYLTLLLTALSAAVILMAIRFEKHFPSAASQYCDRVIVSKTSEILNSVLLDSIKNENTDDILRPEKDAEGNIRYINVDTAKVNRLKSELTLDIISALEDYKRISFGIPLGNALGSYVLSGLGPEIPVKAVPVGSVISKIKSSFTSGGINQTKYELYIEFMLCIEVTSPFTAETREVTGELCIAQTVIVGETNGIIWGSDY